MYFNIISLSICIFNIYLSGENMELGESETVKSVNTIDCPICGSKDSLKIIVNELDIPYIGKVLETTMVCSKCNYKNSDIMPTDVKEPKRYILKIQSEEDLNKRVVRSSTGFIRIPELGFEVKPGVASQGYVSNVEGVLNRLEESLMMLSRGAETEEKKQKAKEVAKKLDAIKQGKETATLIIEDPTGHSLIIGDGVIDEKLTEEEVKTLNKGEFIELKK
jgi:zinc finger protein